MSEQTAICWMNGEVIPAHSAKVSVMDHGLLYGDGIFEGIRFYNGKAFCLAEHIQRLRDSALALCIDIPMSDEQLVKAIEQLIASFNDDRGYIRLVVTRGTGDLGISPKSCKQATVFLIADEIAMVSHEQRTQGIRVITASTRRIAADALSPRVKSLNYLNNILAKIEAINADAQEAIMLNGEGRVAEGTTDNIFIVRQSVLFTPPLEDGMLEGITRAKIISLAEQIGVKVNQQSLSTFDLYRADECFLTGTGAELIPVREIDGRKMCDCPGPIYSKLSDAFVNFIASY